MHMSPELTELLQSLRHDPVAENLLRTKNTSKGDYLSVRNGNITYLPTKKIADLLEAEKNGEVFEPYRPKLRVKTKPAKAARHFVDQHFRDSDFEAFHNRFVASFMDVKQLRVVRGKEIIDIYKTRYSDKVDKNILGYSCMINRNNKAYALYVKNPNMVRMITVWDTINNIETCIARALLWKTEQGIFMDYIYGKDHATKFLNRYARSHGWAVSSMWGLDRDGYERRDVTIPLSSFKYDTEKDEWPFLDTFHSTYYGQYDGKDLKGSAWFPIKKGKRHEAH